MGMAWVRPELHALEPSRRLQANPTWEPWYLPMVSVASAVAGLGAGVADPSISSNDRL